MKNTFKNSIRNDLDRYEIKKFRTFFRTFPHLTVFLSFLFDLKVKMKNAGTPLLSGLPALYPGRESNSYSFKGYRILRTSFMLQSQTNEDI